MILRLRARRQRKADPIARSRRLDADEKEPATGRHAQLGALAQGFAQPRVQGLEERRNRSAAQERALAFGNDANAVLARDPADRLAPLGRVVGLERRAHGLQLHDLGVAELPRQQRQPILPEEENRRDERDRDNAEQQQREAPEQRTRQQRHRAAPAGSASAAPSSGTKT